MRPRKQGTQAKEGLAEGEGGVQGPSCAAGPEVQEPQAAAGPKALEGHLHRVEIGEHLSYCSNIRGVDAV